MKLGLLFTGYNSPRYQEDPSGSFYAGIYLPTSHCDKRFLMFIPGILEDGRGTILFATNRSSEWKSINKLNYLWLCCFVSGEIVDDLMLLFENYLKSHEMDFYYDVRYHPRAIRIRNY